MTTAQVHLCEQDPVMADIIAQLPPPVVESSGNVFFDLVSCVVEQQIHYRARGTYMKKLMDLLQGQWPTPELLLTLNPHEFAQKKIAGNKLKGLQYLASHWQAEQLHTIDWAACTNQAVKDKLLPIKGIGEWTADMILLYTLGRPNVFSPNDFQLKKIMAQCYGLANNAELTAHMVQKAEAWAPHRSLATLYLLAYKDYLKKAK